MTFDGQRRDYGATLAWVGRLMTATRPEQLSGPTPCAEYDVRTLMGHLIGTAYRGLGTARGGSTRAVPHAVTDVADEDLAATYVDLAGRSERAWSAVGSGEQVLVAPWGRCSALDGARGFTVETVTHGWDLAVATGQPSDAPDGVAERCLEFAAATIPDRLRGVMYDDPITSRPGLTPTERLAQLLGHGRNESA